MPINGQGAVDIPIAGQGRRLAGVLHEPAPPAPVRGGIVWLSGAAGGFNGPGGGLYPLLGRELAEFRIASLRITYRWPNDLAACVTDALAAVAALRDREYAKVAVAGHSFGGAVAIQSGLVDRQIAAVLTINGQFYGTQDVAALCPVPLTLLHGTADERLPISGAEEVFVRAGHPKLLVPLPGGSHSLVESAEGTMERIRAWARDVFDLSVWNAPTHPSSKEPVEVALSGPDGRKRRIRLAVGEPVSLRADGLVCPVNHRLKADRAITDWLYTENPRALERELYLNRGENAVGSVVALDLPEMPIPHLFFAVLVAADAPFAVTPIGTIYEVTSRALGLAAERSLRSLILPPLGTTGPRLPLEAVAREMLGAVRRHLRGVTTLEVVTLALPSAPVRSLFWEVAIGLD